MKNFHITSLPMKKIARIIVSSTLISISLMGFTGCNSNSSTINKSTYEKIQETLVTMESYESKADVKYISNKGTNEYGTYQQCKMTGEYRVEVISPENVAGSITVFDGSTISQFNPRISGKVAVSQTESPERSEIFLTTFVNNYLNSTEVSVNVANLDEGQCTVLEATIPGDHPYLATEKLWIDNNTLNPLQLVIYDPDGSERIIVTYSDFKYNVSLDNSIFKAE